MTGVLGEIIGSGSVILTWVILMYVLWVIITKVSVHVTRFDEVSIVVILYTLETKIKQAFP